MEDEEKLDLPIVTIPSFKMNSSFDAYLAEVLHIVTPGLFYLRLLDFKNYFQSFSKNINDHYEGNDTTLGDVDRLLVGTHWCAKDGDNWMRAKVIRNTEEQEGPLQIEMLFIDLGITKTVGVNDVRILDEEFALDQPLAFPCCLSNVFPWSPWEEDGWSERQMEEFVNFCCEADLFHVIFIRRAFDAIFEVVLESTDGRVINEIMSFKPEKTAEIDKLMDGGTIEIPCNDEKSPAELSDSLPENWDPMADDHKKVSTNVNSECAVTMFIGIKNEDESKICKFYRAGRHCPRGDTCRWRHVKPRKDCLSVAKEQTQMDVHLPFQLPEEGSIHPIIVTTTFSTSLFYVQFPEIEHPSGESLNKLRKSMNDYYKKSKPIVGLGTLLPASGQLMAISNPESRSKIQGWHRVKIISIEGEKDECALIKVKYIDLGIDEVVNERYLRKLCPGFLQLPSQAVECYLHGINQIPHKTKEAADHFFKLTENISLVAVIESANEVHDRLGLTILNTWKDEYLYINDDLIEKGFVLPSDDNDN